MSKFTKFTIVYVFGPEQCEDKYYSDQTISLETNEWIKIGETQWDGELETLLSDPDIVRQKAMNRIKGEVRTGIPFPSRIFDLFVFPYRIKTDLKIRNRLCQDLYEIDNSKQMNRDRREDKFSIPAGEEFVYNVQRSKIKYAVQSIDHDLISDEEMDEEQLHQIIKLCRFFNNINLDNNAEETENERETGTRKKNLDLDLVFADVENPEVVLKNGKGDDVVDNEGVPVTAVYVGDNKFDCRGEIARTSPLAKKYLNEFAGMDLKTVNGNEYWYYNGQKLTSLRKN